MGMCSQDCKLWMLITFLEGFKGLLRKDKSQEQTNNNNYSLLSTYLVMMLTKRLSIKTFPRWRGFKLTFEIKNTKWVQLLNQFDSAILELKLKERFTKKTKLFYTEILLPQNTYLEKKKRKYLRFLSKIQNWSRRLPGIQLKRCSTWSPFLLKI